MASGLKWRAGFGWGTVILLMAGLLLVFSTEGVLRVFGGLMALVSGGYAFAQYRKWNSSPWRQVHFRGMLLYSQIAGRHAGLAQQEDRSFDKVAACRELALAMTGPGREANVEAMIDTLVREEGTYFARLLRPRVDVLLESIEPSKREEFLEKVKQLKFGPDLVMCNIVENSYGEEEAARYAYAICSGRAH